MRSTVFFTLFYLCVSTTLLKVVTVFLHRGQYVQLKISYCTPTYEPVVKIGGEETWESAVCTEFPLCHAKHDRHALDRGYGKQKAWLICRRSRILTKQSCK
jgi:hypothetical protein